MMNDGIGNFSVTATRSNGLISTNTSASRVSLPAAAAAKAPRRSNAGLRHADISREPSRFQWDLMFFVDAGVLFIGALTWLFIDARRSVEDERVNS